MAQQTPVWFIVGASSGFGNSIARSALSLNHRVIAASRDPSSSAAMAELQKLGASLAAVDVTWSEEVLRRKIEEVVGVYGHVTNLVNAGGFALGGVNEAISDELAIQQFQVNVLGTMKITRLMTPHLRALPSSTIVNFGSVCSWIGAPSMSHYAASKWAVSGFSESIRLELAPFGVRVMVVEPGYFRTSFLSKGHVVWAEDRMQHVYAGTVADEYRDLAAAYDGNQLGDVERAGSVVVDVVTGRGPAEGRDVPVRLLLGSDCVRDVRKKGEDTMVLIDEWRDVSVSTDHDE